MLTIFDLSIFKLYSKNYKFIMSSYIMEKEYDFFLEYKNDTEYGGPINRENMNIWHVHIEGPEKSDYSGAKLHLKITFPDDYPSSMPTCYFINDTDIFHPNVNDKGKVCFGSFTWKSDYTILDLLNAIYYLLKHPNFGDGYDNQQVKNFYDADPESYHRTVKEIVQEFLK